MCQQYPSLTEKMKAKLKTYNDKLKIFLKVILKSIPFMKNLSAESIEEVTYHLKQKYYDPNEVIFRPGDPVDQLYLITRGEVDLIVNIDNHDFIVHNLYQGCFIGGYRILGDYIHTYTARAVSSVTLHYINKDSVSLLQNNLSDFKAEIELAKQYIEKNKDTIIGFGLFRDERGNVSSGEIFKMAVVKILQLNRAFKEVGIIDGINKVFKRMLIEYYEEEEESEKPKNYQRATLKLMQKLTAKLDNLESQMARMEKKIEKNENANRRQSMMLLHKLGSEIDGIKGKINDRNGFLMNFIEAKTKLGAEKR